MTTQLSVAFPQVCRDAEGQRAILATLPNAFQVVADHADILFLSGRAGCLESALDGIGAGTRSVVLMYPAAASTAWRARLAKLSAEQGIPVFAAFNYVPNFAADLCTWDPSITGDVAILDLTARVVDPGGMADALLEITQIATIVAGPVKTVRTLLESSAAKVVEAEFQSSAAPARLSVYCCTVDRLDFDRVARGRRERIEIYGDAQARPALVSHHDQCGSHLAPPVYQGGYRSAWLALHAALTGPGNVNGNLAEVEAMQALLGR